MAEAAQIDSIIQEAVNQIWDQFDKDKSGALDKEETKAFVTATLTETGQGSFTADEFTECFASFDKNGDGSISKQEMVAFIKQVANL